MTACMGHGISHMGSTPTHDKFIGLGLLQEEHLYKGPRTGQEDGLLTQPSKYFSYTQVISLNLFTWEIIRPDMQH